MPRLLTYLSMCLLPVGLVSPTLADVPEFWPRVAPPTTEARLVTVPSGLERELSQVDALIEAEAYDEAVDAVVRLVGESTEALVPVTDDYYLPLAAACHVRIAQWPAEALAIYRGRVDATAKSLLDAGVAKRDAELLTRLLDMYYTSSYGDDALVALADWELEAGNYHAARGYLLQTSPALTAPDGRPWGVALAGVDLSDAAVQGVIADRVTVATSPANQSAEAICPSVYPDTDLTVADLLARMAMVSIRAGTLDRAATEAAVLVEVQPTATGTIAGRQANLSEAIAIALEAARNWPSPTHSDGWPTAGGSIARAATSPGMGDVSRIQWQRELMPPNLHLAPPQDEVFLGGGKFFSRPLSPSRATFAEPLVGNGAVVVEDNGTWIAVDATTGKPLFGATGQLMQSNAQPADRGRDVNTLGGARKNLRLPGLFDHVQDNVRIQFRGQIVIRNGGAQMLIEPRQAIDDELTPAVPEGMLKDSFLYAVVKGKRNAAISDLRTPLPKRLVAMDLAAEGKLRLEIQPDAGHHICGPPVVNGPHIYLPLQELQPGGRLELACYTRTSGRQLWQTPICHVSGAGGNLEEAVIVATSGTLYLNTSAGVVAAVRARDGHIRWAHTYERSSSTQPNDLSQVGRRHRGACALVGDCLACAPADAASLFALDPMTGHVLWVNSQAYDVSHVLGMAAGRLLVSGRQLWMLDPVSGQTEFVWPNTAAAGITGSGQGCVAGSEVFWPTGRAIYALDIATGQQSRSPVDLKLLGGATDASTSGANVVPCGHGLLVATATRLTLLGAVAPRPTQATPAKPVLGGGRDATDQIALD